MRKIIIGEFFTTVSLNHLKKSLYFITIGNKKLIKGEEIKKAEKELKNYLGLKDSKIVSFYNARSALYHCLKNIKGKTRNEVILNGYNCVSVSNSVIQSGFTPIYCDIDLKDLSFNLDDLKQKISKKTKAIIIQHSFGKTSKIKEILKIAKSNDILVIEDCAHSLGSKYNGKFHGSFGDFSIFSSGRDKVISSVNGGFLLINNEKYFHLKKDIKNKLINPDKKELYKNHLYNILGYISFKTYSFFGLGKIIIAISRKLKLINEILYKEEKKCKNKNLNWKFPNSLASIFLMDLENIEVYNKKRRKIASYYNEKLNNYLFKIVLTEDSKEKINYFRYPIIFKDKKTKDIFYNFMKKNNILLGNSWSDINIAPKGTNLEKAKYFGDCKNAEDISSKILFLPNTKFNSKKDIKKIVNLSNNFKI